MLTEITNKPWSCGSKYNVFGLFKFKKKKKPNTVNVHINEMCYFLSFLITLKQVTSYLFRKPTLMLCTTDTISVDAISFVVHDIKQIFFLIGAALFGQQDSAAIHLRV